MTWCEICSLTYSLLEPLKISRAQGVGFGDNGDKVDPCAEAPHDFDIERLQSVAGRANEVETSMYT